MRDKVGSSKFSWLFMSTSEGIKPEYDVILRETKSFVVLPSLGALVEPWLVVVPKRPVSCLADLNDTELSELNSLSTDLCNSISGEREVFTFEHGGKLGSVVSCSVDQAHLHVVGLSFDLIDAAMSEGGAVWTKFGNSLPDSLGALDGREYLYMSDGKDHYWSYPKEKTSQWFRKLIARHEGCADRWDYKLYPNLSAVRKMAKSFGK